MKCLDVMKVTAITLAIVAVVVAVMGWRYRAWCEDTGNTWVRWRGCVTSPATVRDQDIVLQCGSSCALHDVTFEASDGGRTIVNGIDFGRCVYFSREGVAQACKGGETAAAKATDL